MGNGSSIPIVDLWLAPKGALERPARGYNNSCTGDQPAGAKRTGCVRGPRADPVWGGYEDALLAQQAIALIETHDAATPLFLFWAPHAVHTPLQVPQPYIERFSFMAPTDKPAHERQLYAATVSFIDDAFANISAAFERRGMDQKLLIVMSADNGGPVYFGGFGGANNYPLRGGKLNNWEGGIRVNSFVSGGFLPGVVRGTQHVGLVALWDWYATFCALAGVDATDARAMAAGLPPVDSIDQSAFLLGTSAPRHGPDTPGTLPSPPPRTELALSTEPRRSDLTGAPPCSSYSSAGLLPRVLEEALPAGQADEAALQASRLQASRRGSGASLSRRRWVERDVAVRLPASGSCATLNGLIQLDTSPGGHLWKLLLGDVEQAFVTGPYFPNASTPRSIPAVTARCGRGCLFDLTADPLEASDLAARMPGRVESMRQRLEALLPSAFNPHRGAVDPACCSAALRRYEGFFGPFIGEVEGALG